MTKPVPPLRALRGSALGRPIDLRHASNRLALAGAAAAGLATLVATGVWGEGTSFPSAVRVGIGVFLAWALTRELSPDHVTAAALAMGPAAALAIVEVPEPGAMIVALLAIRAWAGTVGTHPSLYDLAAVIAIAAVAGFGPEMWPATAALAAGIVAHSPHRMPVLAAIGGMTLTLSLVAVITGSGHLPDVTGVELIVLALSTVVVFVVLPIRLVRSHTDRRKQPISPDRVGSGWIAALVSVAGVALFSDVTRAAPLLAAMVIAAAALLRDRLNGLARR